MTAEIRTSRRNVEAAYRDRNRMKIAQMNEDIDYLLEQNATQAKRITALEAEVAQLKARLDAMESRGRGGKEGFIP